MSFVGLKRLFVGQPAVATLSTKQSDCRTPLLQGQVQPSADRDPDLESQSKSSILSERGPRVDPRVISDATIGLSDGLTVPFALTAGLSALGSSRVVIYGGLAELIAGAISMGLGGYLGAKSELASYKASRDQAQELIDEDAEFVRSEIAEVFQPYDLPKDTLEDLTSHLSGSPKLIDFYMQFRNCAGEPAATRAFTSALTIALGYFIGGLVPLLPYFCVDRVIDGLYISIGVMAVALFAFGYVKTCIVIGFGGSRNIRHGFWGGVQMVVVGSAAAASAMALVRAFNAEGSA